MAATAAASGTAAVGIKWHPGHYALLDGILRAQERDSLSATHRAQIALLGSEPTVKGVKIVVQWSAAEGPTEGDYAAGIAMIDRYVQAVSAIGKRLWISFSYTQFGGHDPNNRQLYFPNYIVTDRRYGTTVLADGRSVMARIWQQNTMDRLITMSRFYAARFNSSPWVEGISIGETSINVTAGADGFSYDAVLTQFRRFHSAARTDWPNTAIRLVANYLPNDRQFIDLYAHCASVDCAVGGPDVIPSEDIQANRIFAGEGGLIDYRNIMPFVAEVQSPSLCGHEGCWTPRQLFDHAMVGNPSLGMLGTQPRYFVWFRNTWSGGAEQKWDTGILPFIRSINGAVYSTACPTAYPACITT